MNEPTRQELENEIAKLREQNKILHAHIASQKQEEIKDLAFPESEELEHYTHTVLNNMGDAVFLKDDQSRLLFVNDAFCEMFRLPKTEILGKTLAENVPIEERESFLSIDKKVLEDGIENTNEETLTLIEGNPRNISTRKSRYIDLKGNKFLVGVIRDITDQKRSELILKENESRLRELNATKDKLFSIIAHDLRSPFNNIILLTELLTKEAKIREIPKSEQFLDLIHTTAQNTIVLLDNLFNWAKSQNGELKFKSEKTNIATVISEVLELSSAIAKTKNITLNPTNLEEVEIFSDEKIIKTVLRNLISNAIKYSNPDNDIAVFAVSNKDHVEITVSDNGVGIDETTRKKLFRIATNVSSPGTAKEKGSGFGLILCKEFVEKLGGTIWVESEKGKGSDFIFTLPFENKP